MANRKPKARHDEYYIAVFLTKEEAMANDRDGLVSIQNFDHDLQGLNGLEGLDSENDFADGDVIEQPCYIRVMKRKGHVKATGRKVGVVRNGESTEAAAAPLEQVGF